MKSQEKLYQYYVGIDVSKETIDVSVLSDKNKSAQHKLFANDSPYWCKPPLVPKPPLPA